MKYGRRRRLKEGETRVFTEFLWLPLTLPVEDTDVIETRWLEEATIKQVAVNAQDVWFEHCEWQNVCWMPLQPDML